ncbi:MAG: Fic family protein [Comamonadaceae bacterium]
MNNRLIGYEFLREQLRTAAFPLARPARVAAVTKITSLPDVLAVPASVAPASDTALDHLQFALKHEGMQLQAVMLALKKIEGLQLARAFTKSPSSAYLRQIGYLWELANGVRLKDLPLATGPYTRLFDPARFVTGSIQRNTRWRVDFNGIGSPAYCLTVRRTPELERLLAKNILGAAQAFVSGLDKSVIDRAVRWAYLSETQGSYAIENEKPSAGKTEAFAALLARAHEPVPVSEPYLVALQNLAVTNPMDKAVQFRTAQNWLRNALPGALGVSYLPPPPDLMMSIMDQIMALANQTDNGLDPLVHGALVSFAFVFAHPFMDGNGRLSRFLFHKLVCAQGKLPNGLVLPISVAMKRNEDQYLRALQTFSRPAREMWQVTAIDDAHIDASFKGEPETYRYWDATPCVEFGLQMAEQALEHDLRDESDFLRTFDIAYRAVNEAIDMNNNDLVLLIRSCLQNDQVLSKGRKKQLIARGHAAALIDDAERIIQESVASLTPQNLVA